MSNWVNANGAAIAKCVIVVQRKTPQSYAFSCFGEASGPMVFQDDHDQIGWWYVVANSATRIFSARTYLAAFRAGAGLELYVVILCAERSKTTDHQ